MEGVRFVPPSSSNYKLHMTRFRHLLHRIPLGQICHRALSVWSKPDGTNRGRKYDVLVWCALHVIRNRKQNDRRSKYAGAFAPYSSKFTILAFPLAACLYNPSPQPHGFIFITHQPSQTTQQNTFTSTTQVPTKNVKPQQTNYQHVRHSVCSALLFSSGPSLIYSLLQLGRQRSTLDIHG